VSISLLIANHGPLGPKAERSMVRIPALPLFYWVATLTTTPLSLFRIILRHFIDRTIRKNDDGFLYGLHCEWPLHALSLTIRPQFAVQCLRRSNQ